MESSLNQEEVLALSTLNNEDFSISVCLTIDLASRSDETTRTTLGCSGGDSFFNRVKQKQEPNGDIQEKHADSTTVANNKYSENSDIGKQQL